MIETKERVLWELAKTSGVSVETMTRPSKVVPLAARLPAAVQVPFMQDATLLFEFPQSVVNSDLARPIAFDSESFDNRATPCARANFTSDHCQHSFAGDLFRDPA